MSVSEKDTIAAALGRFVHGLSCGSLPGDVVARAKNRILDALGNALAGRSLPCSLTALRCVTGEGRATIFTHHRKAPPAEAAFVNSALTCGIAQDDVLFTFHPGTVTVPAAIAVAEQEGSPGGELITAVVAGYEVMGRTFMAAQPLRQGFRSGSVFGPLGASAVAGKLFGLTEGELLHALHLAANFGFGLGQWAVSGTRERDFFDGLAGRNGILAATLAREGVVTAAATLEGDKGFYQAFVGGPAAAGEAVRDLGRRFLIMEATRKPYPACGTMQVPIAMVERARAAFRFGPEEIGQMTATLPAADAAFPGTDYAGPFENSMQALLSAPFCLSAAFLGRPVGSHRFFATGYNYREVGDLALRVKVVGERGRVIPRIEIVEGGRVVFAKEEDLREVIVPSDGPVKARFEEIAAEVIGREGAARVIAVVERLETIDSVHELTRELS